ncbi:M18 family aminopeptidase [Sedimentibacter sp. zth1]|uniref:M18 family aminopeptidase n=1 Tax=Sedimentibacter sp. zth1 TaxID=2816908 RepID=UPI001A92CA68|nr:M18 family aminopeptidase [Sedimentibacter sp. zth1]QSX05789.1 M18 family aminopeptidase [Sedimentibacter sp. zth1]
MYKKISKELLNFIEKSHSCFHAIEEIKEELNKNGFIELLESKSWNLIKGKKYYVTRNASSIIAFDIGENLDNYSFNMVASHSDSPTFKIKDNFEIEVSSKYIQLNTEKYGGMLCSTWFDRPLSVAGRVVIKENNKLVTKFVDVDRDLVLIPNVAIHMNRDANSGMKYNEQIDMLPLYGTSDNGKGNFLDVVSETINVKKEDIVSSDLFLYNRMQPSIWGSKEEFISSPKLDDLQCAFTSLKAFVEGHSKKSINVYCCFDNEEVGSGTKQGALSTFLVDVLSRVNEGLNKTKEDYYKALASSFMLSSDNAHAVHPNHPEKSDPTNRVYMNEGVVIKYNANQKYTSDAVSAALFKTYCKNADIPFQAYTNRSDMPGGSTLGNIATTHVSIKMVDIGLAQLAMHSSYETAGMKDTYYMYKVVKEFFNSHIEETGNGVLEIS